DHEPRGGGDDLQASCSACPLLTRRRSIPTGFVLRCPAACQPDLDTRRNHQSRLATHRARRAKAFPQVTPISQSGGSTELPPITETGTANRSQRSSTVGAAHCGSDQSDRGRAIL